MHSACRLSESETSRLTLFHAVVHHLPQIHVNMNFPCQHCMTKLHVRLHVNMMMKPNLSLQICCGHWLCCRPACMGPCMGQIMGSWVRSWAHGSLTSHMPTGQIIGVYRCPGSVTLTEQHRNFTRPTGTAFSGFFPRRASACSRIR